MTDKREVETCEVCEGPMQIKMECAHCGSPWIDPASFDEWWKLELEKAEGVEVEPSPEEEGFARHAWNHQQRNVDALNTKISQLEQQILEIQGNAAIRFAEAEARWHKAEEELTRVKDELFTQQDINAAYEAGKLAALQEFAVKGGRG